MPHKDVKKQGLERPYHRGNTGPDALAAGIKLLHDGGIQAVTTIAVAENIGASRAAVARVFPTRSSLLGKIAEEAIASLGNELAVAAKTIPSLPGKERGKVMGRTYLNWARKNPNEYALLFTTRPPKSKKPRALKEESGIDVPKAFGMGLPPWDGDPAENPAFTVWALLHGLSTLITNGPLTDLDSKTKDRLVEATLMQVSDFVTQAFNRD